jgi:hypothetical protein
VTPPEDPDFSDLQQAIARIEECLNEIAQRRQAAENQQKLIRLAEQVVFHQKPVGFDFLDPKRKLIKQGPVEQLGTASDALAMIGFNNLIKKGDKRTLFLFNDTLLVVKEEKEHLIVKHCVQLLNCHVWIENSYGTLCPTHRHFSHQHQQRQLSYSFHNVCFLLHNGTTKSDPSHFFLVT